MRDSAYLPVVDPTSEEKGESEAIRGAGSGHHQLASLLLGFWFHTVRIWERRGREEDEWQTVEALMRQGKDRFPWLGLCVWDLACGAWSDGPLYHLVVALFNKPSKQQDAMSFHPSSPTSEFASPTMEMKGVLESSLTWCGYPACRWVHLPLFERILNNLSIEWYSYTSIGLWMKELDYNKFDIL
jgi:hypothetical protein